MQRIPLRCLPAWQASRMRNELTQLATFIAETSFAQLPTPLVERAKWHLLDTFGAALAGSDSDIWQRCVELAAAEGGTAVAALWGSSQQVNARQAAWLNGVAAHMYELDDTGGCDHSGAVVVPALLAVLPHCAQPVSGEALIVAMVIGYEVGRRVLEACGGYSAHNGAGWHSTASCGVFGAAAAAASLLRLKPTQCASALGIAASFSGGLWGFIHDGSQTKKLHAGRAAEAGVQATLLARKGISGPEAVFSDRWGSFLNTFAPTTQDPAALVSDLGAVWKLARCSIKPYASCRGTHSAIDALGIIVEQHQLAASDIRRVIVRLNPFLLEMCGGREIASLAAAQMSLPYALAARALYGSPGLDAYAEARRLSPEAQNLMQRIVLEPDVSQSNDEEPLVLVETEQGERWQQHVPVPSGAPGNPLSDAALFAKFYQLARRVLPDAQVQALQSQMLELEHCDDISRLAQLLRRG